MTSSCDIHRSEDGQCYEMAIDGHFYGNYDTVGEAALDYERYLKEQEQEESA